MISTGQIVGPTFEGRDAKRSPVRGWRYRTPAGSRRSRSCRSIRTRAIRSAICAEALAARRRSTAHRCRSVSHCSPSIQTRQSRKCRATGPRTFQYAATSRPDIGDPARSRQCHANRSSLTDGTPDSGSTSAGWERRVTPGINGPATLTTRYARLLPSQRIKGSRRGSASNGAVRRQFRHVAWSGLTHWHVLGF